MYDQCLRSLILPWPDLSKGQIRSCNLTLDEASLLVRLICLSALKNYLALIPQASLKFSNPALISEQSLPRIPAGKMSVRPY